MDDTTVDERPAAPQNVAAPPQPRLDEVRDRVKVELVKDGFGPDERSRGFNPYDGRLGQTKRDVWGTRRRA
jgi:hypothetical protein